MTFTQRQVAGLLAGVEGITASRTLSNDEVCGIPSSDEGSMNRGRMSDGARLTGEDDVFCDGRGECGTVLRTAARCVAGIIAESKRVLPPACDTTTYVGSGRADPNIFLSIRMAEPACSLSRIRKGGAIPHIHILAERHNVVRQ